MNGYAEQYRCATALYLLSMFAYVYNIIIDHSVGAPGLGREVIDRFNAAYKRFLSTLLITVKLPGAETYDPQI